MPEEILTVREYKHAQGLSRLIALITIALAAGIMMMLPRENINMPGLAGVLTVLAIFTVIFYSIPALAYRKNLQPVPDFVYLFGTGIGTYFLGEFAPYFLFAYLIIIGTHAFTHGFGDFWLLTVSGTLIGAVQSFVNPAYGPELRLPLVALHVVAIPLVCYSYWLFATQVLKMRVERLQVQREAKRLAELERMKADFLSLASHEMRTPLGHIKGFVDVLKHGYDRQAVERIEANVDRLLKIVSRMIKVSQAKENKADEKGETNLALLLTDLTNEFAPLALDKSIKLALEDIPPELTLKGPADDFKDALANLIENALRYTPRGGQVQVTAERADDRLKIEVKDNGIGIPAEEQASLGKKFFRATNAEKQEPSGTGLGLYLVKEILSRHGGSLAITSQLNKGTTAKVVLPAGPSAPGVDIAR